MTSLSTDTELPLNAKFNMTGWQVKTVITPGEWSFLMTIVHIYNALYGSGCTILMKFRCPLLARGVFKLLLLLTLNVGIFSAMVKALTVLHAGANFSRCQATPAKVVSM